MKTRKAISAIISTIMLLSMFAIPSYAVGTFTDVADTAYYADAVQWAVDQKIASGTTSTTFSPDQTCTKAEIITFLWRSKGCPEPNQTNTSFPDLDGTEYYFKAAQWAFENGLVTSSNVPFNADTPCTRYSTIWYMWVADGSPKDTYKATWYRWYPKDKYDTSWYRGHAFTDIDENIYEDQAISWAAWQGITAGTGDRKFNPEDTCTRAQIITFLYRDNTPGRMPTAAEIEGHRYAVEPGYYVDEHGAHSAAANGNEHVGLN